MMPMLMFLLHSFLSPCTQTAEGCHRKSAIVCMHCRRIDEPISVHMEAENLEFLQFSFR